MPNIFVSYSRDSKDIAAAVADDIKELGHVVWFDHELSGGQAWWNEILATVRRSDVFVFILTPQALSSIACTREYGYAAALRKPILPVLVAEDVSTNLLPPALAQIHYVDYRSRDRAAGFRLARALASLPPTGPLPDPMPPPPEVPTSYLGSLNEQIESSSSLSYEQQSALLVDLRKGLRDPETAEDSRALLKRLRRRRDLLATIAEEIDELLASGKTAPAAQPKPWSAVRSPTQTPGPGPGEGIRPPEREPPNPDPTPTPPAGIRQSLTRRERMTGAIWGAVLGTAAGLIGMSTYTSESITWAFLTGAGGAVAGMLSGKRRRRIVAALVGAAAGWLGASIFAFSGSDAFAGGAVFGAPSGAVLGAIVGTYLWKAQPGAQSASPPAVP